MNFDANQSFNFLSVPTDIHFWLRHAAHTAGADPGVCAAGIVDKTLDALSAASISCVVYDRFTADSETGLIAEAAEKLNRGNADVVVDLGGGSALDTAKAVAEQRLPADLGGARLEGH